VGKAIASGNIDAGPFAAPYDPVPRVGPGQARFPGGRWPPPPPHIWCAESLGAAGLTGGTRRPTSPDHVLKIRALRGACIMFCGPQNPRARGRHVGRFGNPWLACFCRSVPRKGDPVEAWCSRAWAWAAGFLARQRHYFHEIGAVFLHLLARRGNDQLAVSAAGPPRFGNGKRGGRLGSTSCSTRSSWSFHWDGFRAPFAPCWLGRRGGLIRPDRRASPAWWAWADRTILPGATRRAILGPDAGLLFRVSRATGSAAPRPWEDSRCGSGARGLQVNHHSHRGIWRLMTGKPARFVRLAWCAGRCVQRRFPRRSRPFRQIAVAMASRPPRSSCPCRSS